jgi:hypothetical protein
VSIEDNDMNLRSYGLLPQQEQELDRILGRYEEQYARANQMRLERDQWQHLAELLSGKDANWAKLVGLMGEKLNQLHAELDASGCDYCSMPEST